MKLSARRLDEPFLCGLLSITKIFMLSSFIPSSLLLYQTNALQPFCYITFRVGRTCPKALRYCRRRLQFLDIAHRSGYTAAPAGAERRYGLSRKVIRVEKSIHYPRHIVPPDGIPKWSPFLESLKNSGFNWMYTCVLCSDFYRKSQR